MTLQEFKAWLDGFTDATGGALTPDQVAQVKAKLAVVEVARLWGVPAPIPHEPSRTVRYVGAPYVTC